MMRISVSKDFSSTPGGRLRVMGPDSGEEFRARLVRELKKWPPQTVEVMLDGPNGYGSSFLDEAFGGLIRLRLLDPQDVLTRLQIRASSPLNETYVREAQQYIKDAIALRGNQIG